MATTPRGIYYPDPDSPIANIREHLEQLAQTTDAALGDPEGWTSLDLVNGWTMTGTRTPAYRRTADLVTMRGIVTGGAVGQPCAYLPPGLWSPHAWIVPAFDGTSWFAAMISIDSDDGAITCPGYGTYWLTAALPLD